MLWSEIPAHVRDKVTEWLGAAVVGETSQPGGFSPGVASRLLLSDGRRVFVKAVGAVRNVDAPVLYRREIAVMEYLPLSAPTPRLLHSYDDGEWVVLVMEDVDGVPPRFPWDAAELNRVVSALERLAETLTPAPAVAPQMTETVAEYFTGWRSFAASAQLSEVPDAWAREHLPDLVALESRWPEAARGDTLLHIDLRDDNLLLTPEGAVVVVDWPHAAVGAAWCDLLLMLPSAAMGGTVDPEAVWASFGPAQNASADDVNAVLAAAAGFFLYRSTLPVPQNLPTLRDFQRSQGDAALRWLRARLDA
ncbi:phosphotransferase family protein [Kineosporia babensis]|uniref:Phosphotransferase n=1 Tax=Kineosporia babensis TaxID=499548 RepID=A0A9X1NCQ2_9ACTN|nr:phosphotransferase [Kineosporia babensis]MCD5311356.1 phosphotransferase [Kineosporia babensis]